MEIRLEKRAVKQIRVSALDAIEEGDTETLREDIIEVFSDDQIEEIERHIDTADFYDFLSDILDEWATEDVDELFELLEAQLGDAGIEVKYATSEVDDEEEEEEAESDDDSDEDSEEFPVAGDNEL